MSPGDIVWVDLAPRPRRWLGVIVSRRPDGEARGGPYYDVLFDGRVRRIQECWLLVAG